MAFTKEQFDNTYSSTKRDSLVFASVLADPSGDPLVHKMVERIDFYETALDAIAPQVEHARSVLQRADSFQDQLRRHQQALLTVLNPSAHERLGPLADELDETSLEFTIGTTVAAVALADPTSWAAEAIRAFNQNDPRS